jgi:pimeloyl-ACP methyl ester carboxylesterase
MILIPGLACGGNVWDATVEHFKNTHECHVVTIAGFAGQPAVADASVARVIEELKSYILDKKLQHPIIIGHSLGGFLAYWLGAELPAQIGPIIAVDGVPFYPALAGPDATPESQKPKAEMMRKIITGQTREQFAALNKMTLSVMITDPKELERIAASSNQSDPKAVAQAFYELMTIDLRDKLKSVQSPVLLVGSTSAAPDSEAKKRLEEFYRAQVAAVPKHKVVFAPKAKHFIQLDEPDFFYQEVESFLKEADAAK